MVALSEQNYEFVRGVVVPNSIAPTDCFDRCWDDSNKSPEVKLLQKHISAMRHNNNDATVCTKHPDTGY